ncbi:MAG: rod shape-determining protein RodA [Nitrospirota bacterium]
MIDRQIITQFDWKILLLIVIISIIGITTIYSVTYYKTGEGQTPIYIKQIYWIIIGFVVFLFMMSIDYHELARYSYIYYIIFLILLILVLFIGKTGGGAKRWLSLGFISFQPSEFAKIVLIFVFSKYFSENKRRDGLNLSQLILPIFILSLFIILILKEPDLGTALSMIFIFISLLFVVGLRYKYMGFFVLISLMISPFAGELLWRFLKDYQKDRLLAFINPASDPTGGGYHLLQSKIAIGSGGLFGKGLFGGTQSQLKFLPESHTDFIFAVYAEEWGFIGVSILIGLYLLLILWGIGTAFEAKDSLGSLLACGVLSMLIFYIFVNIGMTLGVMPVVGIPLPLMSYGGTSIVSIMGGLGILLNVKMRRLGLF